MYYTPGRMTALITFGLMGLLIWKDHWRISRLFFHWVVPGSWVVHATRAALRSDWWATTGYVAILTGFVLVAVYGDALGRALVARRQRRKTRTA